MENVRIIIFDQSMSDLIVLGLCSNLHSFDELFDIHYDDCIISWSENIFWRLLIHV